MKNFKKLISLALAALLFVVALNSAAVPVFAANIIEVSDYSGIAALSSEQLSGATLSLTGDISATNDISISNINGLTILLNGHTLALNGNTLSFTDAGKIAIYGSIEDASVGGSITAENDAVHFDGNCADMEIMSNVGITSQNGNAVVNDTGNRLTVSGAKLNAPNGCGVYLGAVSGNSCNLAISIYNDNFTEICARLCVGAYVKLGGSGTKACVDLKYGAILKGERIFDSDNLSVTSYSKSSAYAITGGTYSENITKVYKINIRSGYQILNDGKLFSVFQSNSIKNIKTEEGFVNALKKSGAYYINGSFTVSEPVTVTSDANVIIVGKTNKTLTFANESEYLNIADGVDYQLTFVDAKINGDNAASFYSFDTDNLNDIDSNVRAFNCNFSNHSAFLNVSYSAESDMVLNSEVSVPSFETLTVDLNGKALSGSVEPMFLVKGALNIKDSVGGGRVVADKVFSADENAVIKIYGGTFSENVYEYVATDAEVFNIRNDDNSNTVYSSSDVLYGNMNKEADDAVTADSLVNLGTVGYQIKASAATLEGNGIDTQGLRIITAVNEGLLKSANIKDYGYIVAGYSGEKEQSELNFGILTVNSFNGQKVISCKGSTNSMYDEYGNVSADTKYKYITLAVNGMENGDKVVARFYITTTNGKTYYSKYQTYNGLLAEYK